MMWQRELQPLLAKLHVAGKFNATDAKLTINAEGCQGIYTTMNTMAERLDWFESRDAARWMIRQFVRMAFDGLLFLGALVVLGTLC
jgi:hypothetical protein